MNWKSKFFLPKKPFALPLRGISGRSDYCWEDWHSEMKVKYPKRYWLWNTLPNWFNKNIKSYFKKKYKYLLYNFHPKYKYHLLDLRQPINSIDSYRYGWLEFDTKILYACFNVLVGFVESSSTTFVSMDAACNEEINRLYRYWKVDRPALQQKYNEVLNSWSKLKKPSQESQIFFNQMSQIENQIHYLDEQNLIALIKARSFMWR